MSPTNCLFQRRTPRGGATVEVELPHFQGGKQVSIKIPPGVKSGTKLRLRQMGRPLPNQPYTRGDLYLQLEVA